MSSYLRKAGTATDIDKAAWRNVPPALRYPSPFANYDRNSSRTSGNQALLRRFANSREAATTSTSSPSENVVTDGPVATEKEVSSQPGTAPPAQAAERPATAAEQPANAAPHQAPQNAEGRDAPAATYVIPFDRHPKASPGERIIFAGEFSDPSPNDYKLEYSTTGGHFDSATGAATKTIAGLISGNVNFFVPTPWDGTSAVQVVLNVKKVSDSSVVRTETWDFALKTQAPTTIAQKEPSTEVNLPGTYTYDLGPALPTGHKPFYEHTTILEKFGSRKLANIVPDDIKPAYLTAHPLANADAVSQHFLPAYNGNNGTFTVDNKDQISDEHSGHPDLSNLVSNLKAPKKIQVALPQTYEATPGTALGNFTITRILKADGSTWKVKKG